MGKTLSFTLTIALALVLASCNDLKVKAPKNLLSEDRMVEIITDIDIIEAKFNFADEHGKSADSMKTSYYNQLYEHHGITKEQLVDNINYYTQKPELLENIMTRVVDSLTKAQGNTSK